MKKYLYSLFGTVIGGVICNLLFYGIGKIAIVLDLRLFNSEEEASRNFVIFLIFFLLSIIAGGIKGYYLGKKRMERHVLQKEKKL